MFKKLTGKKEVKKVDESKLISIDKPIKSLPEEIKRPEEEKLTAEQQAKYDEVYKYLTNAELKVGNKEKIQLNPRV